MKKRTKKVGSCLIAALGISALIIGCSVDTPPRIDMCASEISEFFLMPTVDTSIKNKIRHRLERNLWLSKTIHERDALLGSLYTIHILGAYEALQSNNDMGKIRNINYAKHYSILGVINSIRSPDEFYKLDSVYSFEYTDSVIEKKYYEIKSFFSGTRNTECQSTPPVNSKLF